MDEIEVCEICGAETECTFTGDGRTLCEECLEAEGYEQCDICEEYYQNCVIDDDDRRLCPTCKAENPTLLELMDTCRYVRENINFEVMTYDDVFQEEVRNRINDIICRAIKNHDEKAKAELEKISDDYDNGIMYFDIVVDEDEDEETVDICRMDEGELEDYVEALINDPEFLSALGYDVKYIVFNHIN